MRLRFQVVIILNMIITLSSGCVHTQSVFVGKKRSRDKNDDKGGKNNDVACPKAFKKHTQYINLDRRRRRHNMRLSDNGRGSSYILFFIPSNFIES